MAEIRREFLGVWIPREIYLNQDLDEFDMILLCEIHSLSKLEHGCIAGNDHFADFMRRGRLNSRKAMILMVQRSIAKLKNLNLVQQVSFDGRTRVLKTCLEVAYIKNDTSDTSNLIQQPLQKPDTSHVESDTYNNTEKNTIKDLFVKEEKNGIEIPESWDANEFGKYWNKFVTYLHEKTKKKMPQTTANELVRQLILVSREDFEIAKKIIDRTIIKRYTEFYELPKNHDNTQQPNQSNNSERKFTDDYYKNGGKKKT